MRGLAYLYGLMWLLDHIIVFLLIGVSVWAFWALGKIVHDRRLAREAELAGYRLRADSENAYVLRGDPVGIEGDYPAATMPLTRPNDWGPEDWKLPPDWSQIVRPR